MGDSPRKVRGVGESTKQKVGRLVLGVDAREFPGGLLRLDPPLRMPSLLPHDLCHEWNVSCQLPADNHDGVIIHLEPDILKSEAKWALGSITTNKASRGDGIPAELFQILKDDAVKMLHSICEQICKTQQWSRHWKRPVFISIPKKDNAK